jgi:hypothetical protein
MFELTRVVKWLLLARATPTYPENLREPEKTLPENRVASKSDESTTDCLDLEHSDRRMTTCRTDR